MAEAVNVDVQWLYLVEKGEISPKLNIAMAIAAEIGATIMLVKEAENR